MTVLVIDIGSSSVRAMLFDDRATAIPGAVVIRPYQFTTTPPGAAVADAALLREFAEGCIDEILAQPESRRIDVVGMAAFTGSLLGLDESGSIITPVYTYADTRSAPDVHLLDRQIDLAGTHQRTGCRNHTTYWPGRLHWLRRTDPVLFGAVRQWLDIGAYLYRLWFGDAPTSYSMASWTGMLNRAALAWDADWLAIIGLDAGSFPRLADYDHMQRGLVDAYARRWPSLRHTPFCLALGDGAAANVGSGATDRSTVALTLGTTAAVRVILEADTPPVPPGLWGYRLDARHHVIGGATFEGGNIFRWARQTLCLPDDSAIEAELAQREPDSHGLTLLPLLGGERSPGWMNHATGAITGLRFSTTPLDILQAALEGVALRIALTTRQLAAVADNAVIMAGGGALSASPGWAQIIANALNRPLHLVAEPEVTARGTAILALRALGRCELSDFSPGFERVVSPRPDHAAIMRQALERQAALYERLAGAWS